MTQTAVGRVAETTEIRLVELLRSRILNGGFQIGERLRQDVISREFGVSSTPVREAFRRLAAEGLLTLATNRGAIVRALDLDERVEVLELLRLIEVHNMQEAIPRATPQTVVDAAAIQKELRETADSVQWASLNREFHWTLGEPSGRPRELGLLRELLNLSALHVRDDISQLVGRREEALGEHDRILAAYAAGDVELACAEQAAHSTRALTALLARAS